MVEELGMAMWGSDIRIFSIDGGAENESAYDNDDTNSNDENEAPIEQTNHKTLNCLLWKYALMMQHK